jgi:hypothetical protein
MCAITSRRRVRHYNNILILYKYIRRGRYISCRGSAMCVRPSRKIKESIITPNKRCSEGNREGLKKRSRRVCVHGRLKCTRQYVGYCLWTKSKYIHDVCSERRYTPNGARDSVYIRYTYIYRI